MDLAAVWQRVLRAFRREPGVFGEVGSDEKATGEAILVAVASALIGGLGTIWAGGSDAGSWIGTAVVSGTVGLAIGVGILFLIGKLFQSRGTYMALFRAGGYASAPTALGIVPVVGGIAGGVWSIVLMIRAVRETQEVSDGAAVAIVLIPVAVGILIAVLAFATFFAAMLGLGIS